MRRYVLAALAGLSPADAVAAPFDFETFFSGHLTGSGVVDNRRDGSHRPFTGTIDARWDGAHGALSEDLVYADGEKKRFAWTFDRVASGRYVGHRDDLVGDAAVTAEGDALRMRYTAHTRLPSGTVLSLSFDDRFEQTGPGTVTITGAVTYLFVGVGATYMTVTRTGR